MNRKLGWLAIGLGLFFAFSAVAGDLPRCWKVDQPRADIQDGLYRLFFDSESSSAQEFASVLFSLQGAMVKQTAVGTRCYQKDSSSPCDFPSIEIDLLADVTDWRPSSAFPTLDSLKTFILGTLQSAAQAPGVAIECAKEVHSHPPRPKP